MLPGYTHLMLPGMEPGTRHGPLLKVHGVLQPLPYICTPSHMQLWDLRMRNAVVTCKGHSSPILRVRLSPDGRWVASGDQEGQVKVNTA